MAKKVQSLYERVFFDRLLLTGVIFLAVSYILQGTWASAFTESLTIMIGTIWAWRAIMTNPSKVFRLLAALVLVLIWSLLAFYLGAAHELM